jgi:hypothetical protein
MSISRGTLPQEFFDSTSASMLIAPQPQFFYAAMWMQAVNASLDLQSQVANGIGLAGRPVIGANGAPVNSFEQNQLLLEPDPILGSFLRAETELGKKPGHVLRMNRPIFASTTYTQASREVGANVEISTTSIGVNSAQASLTLKRFAGPYDAVNSRVAPIGVDAFDSSIALHKTAQLIGMHMHQDRMKFVDTVIATLLDNASNTVRPAGFSADNASVEQGDAPMDLYCHDLAAKTLDEANVPLGPDGKRVMVLHPNQIMQLQADPRFQRLAKELPPLNPLLAKSYRYTTSHFHIFQSTSLRTATNSSSKTIYKGHAFGPQALGVGVGMLPEIRQSTADNYGEQAKVIWVAYEAFDLLDASFGCVLSTS